MLRFKYIKVDERNICVMFLFL